MNCRNYGQVCTFWWTGGRDRPDPTYLETFCLWEGVALYCLDCVVIESTQYVPLLAGRVLFACENRKWGSRKRKRMGYGIRKTEGEKRELGDPNTMGKWV